MPVSAPVPTQRRRRDCFEQLGRKSVEGRTPPECSNMAAGDGAILAEVSAREICFLHGDSHRGSGESCRTYIMQPRSPGRRRTAVRRRMRFSSLEFVIYFSAGRNVCYDSGDMRKIVRHFPVCSVAVGSALEQPYTGILRMGEQMLD